MTYAWKDFDNEIVKAISRGAAEHIVKDADGGMTCPLVAHKGEWLHWQDRNYAHGTVAHGEPELTFRVEPTYVLLEPINNFIVGHELVREAIKGEWGKAETHRLGHENSEDAVTFNVFHFIQKAGELRRVAKLITGHWPSEEPSLFVWGRQVKADGSSSSWDQLRTLLNRVEPTHRQQTEPDVCMYVQDWGWIFIEAKFAFGIKTPETDAKFEKWVKLYPTHAPALFDRDRISCVRRQEFPEQLLRNIVFAHLICRSTDRAQVVSLGRQRDKTPVIEWVNRCLVRDCSVNVISLNWEQIYSSLPAELDSLKPVRNYFEGKSYSLRRAFNIS